MLLNTKRISIFVLLLATLPCAAQTTAVTATVADSTAQVYANGTWVVQFHPNGFDPSFYKLNGSSFAQYFQGSMNSSGTFNVTLSDNSQITPTGSTWDFTVCPNANVSQCTTILGIAVSGVTMNVSSQINSQLGPIQVKLDPNPNAKPLARAYSDTEIANPVQGAEYYNVVDFCIHTYNGTVWSNTCSGGGGGGINPGTPFQIIEYNAAGNNGQDSSIADDSTVTPQHFPRAANGLSVMGNAYGKAYTNSPAGTTQSLLACMDTSVTSSAQITTCPTSTSSAVGILHTGAGTAGTAQVSILGFDQCIFDNGPTVIGDFAIPSTTDAGQCHDAGASRPTGVQQIGRITSINSTPGTLATIDLGPWDLNTPGSSGGTGTISSGCVNGVAYYTGMTVIGADCSFTTDGVGHGTIKSLGFTDPTLSGFYYQTQGTLPTLTATNSVYYAPGASVATTYGIQPFLTKPTAGHCVDLIAGDATNWLRLHDFGSPCSSGTGTVTTFSSGDLAPLFTTTVTNPTTTPALAFNLTSAGANTIFGNFTGGTTVPVYNAVAACGDTTHALGWVAGTGFVCYNTTGIKINGSFIAGTNGNFNDTTPTVPANSFLIKWQKNTATPDTAISAYLQGDGTANCFRGDGTIGACGGGGPSKVPFDSCNADQTINRGNSYWRTITYTASGVTSADIATWEDSVGVAATIICKSEVPSNASGTTHVFLDLASNDATAGHTAAFKVAYGCSTSQNINGITYTTTATQNYTSTTTAYANTRLDFTTTSCTIGEYFVANIIQNSGGTNTQPIRVVAKVKWF